MKRQPLVIVVLLMLMLFSNVSYSNEKSTNKYNILINKCDRNVDDKCCNKLIARFPDKPAGYYCLGILALSKSNYSEALDYTLQGESKSSESDNLCMAANNKARIYSAMKEFEKAKELANKVLNECSNSNKEELLSIVKNAQYDAVEKNVGKIVLGMTKKQVLTMVGSEPNRKQAVSLKQGVFECWNWYIPPYAILYMNERVVKTGMYSCPLD